MKPWLIQALYSPKYEDVNYGVYSIAMNPERDMDSIQSIKWHYAGEQPEYNEFITSNVVITWVGADDEVKLPKKHSAKEKGVAV